jgi:flagellar protein FlaG
MIDDVVGRDAIPAPLVGGTHNAHREAQDQAVEPTAKVIGGPSEVDHKTLEAAAMKIRDSVWQVDSNLRIEIDSDTHRVVIKVFNDQSGEMIRQIPAQEMLEIAKQLEAMQGLLLTKRT